MLNQLVTFINGQLALHSEDGQGMAEYALIIALVAIVLVAALGTLSGGIGGVFDSIVGSF